MIGAQTTEQGDCSKFKRYTPLPHCCKKIPTVVDFLPSVPYYQQFPNCCKGGVVAALGISEFEATIGQAGNTSKTVRLPQNFTLLAPGARYTCRPAKIVPSTIYISPDRRRKTRAFMTWDAICKYTKG
ncbi:COBRA extracellular glycosyl-phosphatidyl inositol-anchored protein family [Trifolium repens]|nr:COBRA extracellular glycosyl-phosphatidyl inositol-anchored protein family [Trifolium repens]